MKPSLFFVIPSLNKGGAERVIAILSNKFASRGYKVSLIVLNNSRLAYDINEDIPVYFLINRSSSENIFNRACKALKLGYKFFSLALTKNPNIIISFTTTANYWTAIVSILLGIEFLVSERTNPARTIFRFNYLNRKLLFFLYKRAKAIVAPSQGIIQELESKLPAKNYKLIRNPISEFNYKAKVRECSPNFILAVGRLNHIKGFDLLIEAFNNVKNNASLIIVGEGPERTNLQTLINNLKLEDRIFLVGSKDNLQSYYDKCKLFILSSRNEGYPNTLIEAMSCGCASLAFDCDFGPREIIKNNYNGMLVEQGNINKLSEQINYLLENPDVATQLGYNARKIAEENSIENIVHQWERVIK